MARIQMGTRAKQKAPSMVMKSPFAREADGVGVLRVVECVCMPVLERRIELSGEA